MTSEGFVRIEDVYQATDYAEKGILPEDYYKARWNETILLSDELTEKQKIQWKHPQVILIGGLQRSGKSTVAETIKDEFNEAGIPCTYLNSDTVRKPIAEEVEEQLAQEGKLTARTEEYANERQKRIYSPANRQRAYDELYKAAGEYMLEKDGVVIVDATHISDAKRVNAIESIQKSYGTYLPTVTFLEVSNDREQAAKIYQNDQNRLASARQGIYTGDKSEALVETRERDQKLYEPIITPHIKIRNYYESAEALREHVKKSLFARKVV